MTTLQLLTKQQMPYPLAATLPVPSTLPLTSSSAARVACGAAHGPLTTRALLGLPAGPLTVDLQGCSRERGLVIVVAWLSRAALLPQDCVPDAQIIFGRLRP